MSARACFGKLLRYSRNAIFGGVSRDSRLAGSIGSGRRRCSRAGGLRRCVLNVVEVPHPGPQGHAQIPHALVRPVLADEQRELLPAEPGRQPSSQQLPFTPQCIARRQCAVVGCGRPSSRGCSPKSLSVADEYVSCALPWHLSCHATSRQQAPRRGQHTHDCCWPKLEVSADARQNAEAAPELSVAGVRAEQ